MKWGGKKCWWVGVGARASVSARRSKGDENKSIGHRVYPVNILAKNNLICKEDKNTIKMETLLFWICVVFLVFQKIEKKIRRKEKQDER